MPTLFDLIPTSNLGYKGGQPPYFDLGKNSTLHNLSSLDNEPPFSSYADPYLRTLTPTHLSPGTLNPVKYLDNPPK